MKCPLAFEGIPFLVNARQASNTRHLFKSTGLPLAVFCSQALAACRELNLRRQARDVVGHVHDDNMTAENLVGLLEEMMDLKLQQYAQAHLKLTPEVAQILNEKRETDRRRLAQVRSELVRFLQT